MNSNYIIVGIVVLFVAAGAFFIGQRTTCFNFFGLAKTCVFDTTRH